MLQHFVRQAQEEGRITRVSGASRLIMPAYSPSSSGSCKQSLSVSVQNRDMLTRQPNSFIHAIGVYFFTKGFLLTRLVLDHLSECHISPVQDDSGPSAGSPAIGCWHPKSFDKAVIIIVDALRYDFTVPWPSDSGLPAPHYRDAFPVLYDTAVEQPHTAFLLPFIADPPTTTLQRLKGLTTGTLPTFIDAGSNFAGTAIEEDNLVAQLRSAGKKLVHLGDDTWQSLFPGYFDPSLSRPYDSLNVWDLHTVDNGVTQHLLPLLHSSNSSQWDVIFGHYLGADHAGHRYGPDHPAMTAKLRQMDGVFRNIIAALDDSTLLVVMGDHGMDVKGDHGGESDDEVQAALWMYSKKGIFGRRSSADVLPPQSAKDRAVWQIDLVPTLALLLGIPIPFNNLGAPIQEAFIGRNGDDWANMAAVSHLTGAQVKRYQHEYVSARGLHENTMSSPVAMWKQSQERWDEAKRSSQSASTLNWSEASKHFSAFQAETLRICKDLWGRFDVPCMLEGILILLGGVAVIIAYVSQVSNSISNLNPALLNDILKRMVLGSIGGGSLTFLLPISTTPLDGALLGCATTSLASIIWKILREDGGYKSGMRVSLWSWAAIIFTICQSIGFASNSYTIWEDEILLFFISTFGVLAIVCSLRQPRVVDRRLGVYQSILFIFLTRIASLSRLCREEQMPYCRSTYYASVSSSTSAPWQLLLPFALSILIPGIIKSYYEGTRSYEGSAPIWIGVAARITLLLTAMFWALDTADDADWVSFSPGTLKTTKVVTARLILGQALATGTTTYFWAKPCVRIETSSRPLSTDSSAVKPIAVGSAKARPPLVTILGYANTHGTRYFLLLINFTLALILLQKPMGHLSLGILVWQILCLLEILDSNALTGGTIGPVILGLLGNYHFFKTGHQATLSSIQWEAAFIPLKEIRYPWSPMLIVGNTFAAQILCTIAVPLVALWKKPPRHPTLLQDVGRAIGTYLAYHAVVNLATTIWAGWLRRHLMLYRIFLPRWMVGAAVLLVCDLVGFLIAAVGVRWSTLSVAEVFGWA